jgi:hypothetical protein
MVSPSARNPISAQKRYSIVSARGYGPFGAILMGSECTGVGVSISKANEVFDSPESWGMAPSQTSAGVVANVPHRPDGSGGFMNAQIEHFVYIISALVALLRISSFIIGHAMGANAIHSFIVNVSEDLPRISPALTTKRKRMLATNQEGEETVGCTSFTSTCTNVLLCVSLFPHHVCKQQLTSIFSF